jgi:hypothetical protein
MGFCSSGVFPHNQVQFSSSLLDCLPGLPPTRAHHEKRCAVWRLAQTSLSACSPNLCVPSRRCSGCESVPSGGLLHPKPSGRSPPELFSSPGYYPYKMATLRVTCSLMRFSLPTTISLPSKLNRQKVESWVALQRVHHQVRYSTPRSEISPPEVLRPSSTFNSQDASSLTQCASGQIAHSSLDTRFRAPRAS